MERLEGQADLHAQDLLWQERPRARMLLRRCASKRAPGTQRAAYMQEVHSAASFNMNTSCMGAVHYVRAAPIHMHCV